MKFCLIIICKEKNETFWKWVWYPYTSKCTAIAHLYTHSMHSWRILFFVFASLMFIKLVLLLTSVIMHLSLFVSIVLLNLQTYYLVNHNITYFIFFSIAIATIFTICFFLRLVQIWGPMFLENCDLKIPFSCSALLVVLYSIHLFLRSFISFFF